MINPTIVDTSEKIPSYLWACTNGSYLKLSASAYYLLKSIEAGSSFEAIAASLSDRQDRIVLPAEVEAAYQLVADQIAAIENREEQSLPGFLFRAPFITTRLVVPITRLLAYAYHPVCAALLLVGSILSFGLVLHTGIQIGFSPTEYWIGYLFFLIALIGHELGHASACTRYGAQPSDIGLGVYWIYPVFYSDVSAAWQLKRWQRVVVDLGGAYFQAIVAAVYGLAYLVYGWAPLKVAIVMVVFSGVFLLNPILKFDGYWIIADSLGVTNLGKQPARLLRYVYARLRGRPAGTLPWPTGITILLGVYTVVTLGFWAYFSSMLVPLLWQQLRGYPMLLTVLFEQLRWPPHIPQVSLLVSLLTSSFLLVTGWFIVWRLVKLLVPGARALADSLLRRKATSPSEGVPG